MNSTRPFSAAPKRADAFCHAVFMGTLLGPLIGGAIYNWTLVLVPYSYLLGVGPAFIASTLFALWLTSQAAQPPHWALRIVGVICAVVGTLVFTEVMESWKPNFLKGLPQSFAYLVPHSIFAALVQAPLIVKQEQRSAR